MAQGSTAQTENNRAQAQKVYSAVEKMLADALHNEFSGTAAVKVDVKHGSILSVEREKKERL